MASSESLRTQVAEVVRENSPCPIVMGAWPKRTADAAIRVVLAAVAEQVEAEREPDHYLGSNAAVIDSVLAVVARLGGEA